MLAPQVTGASGTPDSAHPDTPGGPSRGRRPGRGHGFLNSVGSTRPAGLPLDPAGLPDPAPERFFAPSAEEEARRAVGADGADTRRREYQAAEERFTERAAYWFRVTTRTGPDAMADAFRQLIQGPGDPAVVRVVRPTAASRGVREAVIR